MVLARVVIHVLARVLPHVLARVLLHVLARVIIHMHDYYSKTCLQDTNTNTNTKVEIWESNSGSVGIHEKEVVRHSICENNGGKLGPGGTREGLSLPTLYTPKGVFARQKM